MEISQFRFQQAAWLRKKRLCLVHRCAALDRIDAPKRPEKGWIFNQISGGVSVGVRTRTEIGWRSIGVDCCRKREQPWRAVQALRSALAGAPFWLYAGGVAPCPEPRGLKAQRPVFRQVLTPRLPSLSLGAAVRSHTESTTTMKAIVERPADSAGEFAALAAAVSPAWHQAIIRLANSTERVAFRLEAFMGASMETGFVPCARDLARALIDFLDELDADPDLEPSLALFSMYRQAGADECEIPEDAEQDDSDREDDGTSEPSLGSLDHHHSQERWAAGGRRDLEQDFAESGIADLDGLLEQVGTQDWQQGAMA